MMFFLYKIFKISYNVNGDIMIYESIDNTKIKEIKKLNQKKYRDKSNLFIVEGEHLVLEAYKRGILKQLILESGEVFNLDVETMYVSNNVLNYLSELDTPQKIMGVVEKQENKRKFGNKILLLDGIQDPGNLGTIIRSAVAFHIDTIILGNGTVDLYNSKVIRGSQGMIFHTNIIKLDLLDIIPSLKQNEYKIIGTKVTHGKSLKTIDKFEKFAIIMGNEGNGMSDTISELTDFNIYIDMNPDCESLNVGVATSIILYELDK